MLLDSAFLGKLEQLHLLARRRAQGEGRAERRSRRVGSSLEFADFRPYVPGDEPRSVDWNVYGRLDRLFVKLYEQERDLPIAFLVDASASMRWPPGGARTKLEQACHLAAALAYIGLANLDRVEVAWFGETFGPALGGARGTGQFHRILEFLRHPPAPAGPTCLAAALRDFAQRSRRRGLVFLLGDLFDPAGFEEALSFLQYEQFELHVIQILDESELDPAAAGDLRLLDPETGAALEVTADPALLTAYRREVEAYLQRVTEFCRRRGIGCARALTSVPFEDLVLRTLRDGFILR